MRGAQQAAKGFIGRRTEWCRTKGHRPRHQISHRKISVWQIEEKKRLGESRYAGDRCEVERL